MKDITGLLAEIRRPRLLLDAARHSAAGYRRERDLHKLLRGPGPKRSGEAVMRLMEIEAELDSHRRAGAAHYSIPRHIRVLGAMLGEAQALRTV